MNKIQNPTAKQIGWALLPAIIICVVGVVMKHLEVWMAVIVAVSIISYLGIMTYFCIKQKCYTQLLRVWIAITVTSAILATQFTIINHAVAQLSAIK